MALGGGTFTVQNKVLPGSYINFVSASGTSNVFGERGTGAVGMSLDWCDGTIHRVTKEDFQKKSLSIFGYEYGAEKLAWARDFFKNGKTLIFAGLNTNGAVKAKNEYCTAKYYGTRGNSLKIVVENNVDESGYKDVSVYLDTTLVSKYTVTNDGLSLNDIEDDYVAFNVSSGESGVMSNTAGTLLTGGVNGSVTGTEVQNFLSGLESYSFNAMTTWGYEDELVLEWTKRMRDEVGKKFQCVVYDVKNADYEGCVVVPGADEGDFDNTLPWVCGALAGCAINESLTNKVYDGEFLSQEEALEYASNYSQTELEELINKGYFTFHRVGDEVRVLTDINSLVETTENKGEIFKENQTVRVCDQIANDIATIFNTYYLGKVQNDEAGRSAFKSEIVKHHNKLMDLRAIENFSSEDVTVEQGDTKRSVVVTDNVTIVNAMEQLYMTVVIE